MNLGLGGGQGRLGALGEEASDMSGRQASFKQQEHSRHHGCTTRLLPDLALPQAQRSVS
jgi:hypothetical protein